MTPRQAYLVENLLVIACHNIYIQARRQSPGGAGIRINIGRTFVEAIDLVEVGRCWLPTSVTSICGRNDQKGRGRIDAEAHKRIRTHPLWMHRERGLGMPESGFIADSVVRGHDEAYGCMRKQRLTIFALDGHSCVFLFASSSVIKKISPSL
jgi:hypothetical protein